MAQMVAQNTAQIFNSGTDLAELARFCVERLLSLFAFRVGLIVSLDERLPKSLLLLDMSITYSININCSKALVDQTLLALLNLLYVLLGEQVRLSLEIFLGSFPLGYDLADSCFHFVKCLEGTLVVLDGSVKSGAELKNTFTECTQHTGVGRREGELLFFGEIEGLLVFVVKRCHLRESFYFAGIELLHDTITRRG